MAGTLMLTYFNGTTQGSISLIDGVNYSVTRGSWAPRVASPSRSLLANGRYENVTEQIDVNALGATPGSVFQNLQNLQGILDAAERWYLNTDDYGAWGTLPVPPPVQLLYKPAGGTYLGTAVIVGRDGATDDPITLSDDFDTEAGVVRYTTAPLKFARRGQWISNVSRTFSPVTMQSSTVGIVAGTPLPPARSPFSATLSGFSSATTATISAGYLTFSAAPITVLEAASIAGGAFSAINASAANARGGSVLRHVSTGTIAIVPGVYLDISSPATARWLVLAAVRNTGTAASFQLAARFYNPNQTDYTTTAYETIDTSSTLPRLIPLGPVAVARESARWFTLSVIPTAVGGTLEINYLALLVVNNETTAIINHGSAILTSMGTSQIVLENRPHLDRTPTIRLAGSVAAGDLPLTYSGDLNLMSGTRDSNIYAGWFATSGTNWKHTNTGGTAIVGTITITRYDAMVIPE